MNNLTDWFFKWLIRLFQRRYEQFLDGPFDVEISRKLDAIQVLLDD